MKIDSILGLLTLILVGGTWWFLDNPVQATHKIAELVITFKNLKM